jgi:aminopeptidase
MSYIPPKKILERYADVLVNFALGKEKGIKKGDVVLVNATEICKPLYREILRAVWKAGGHVIGKFTPDASRDYPLDKEFHINASKEQLTFFPKKLMRAQIDQIDHSLRLDAEVDPHSMSGVDSKRIMTRNQAWYPYKQWFFEKENQGKLTWTVALYGTAGMAKEAKMSEKEYWNQIIKACFLNKPNPVREWKKISKKIETYRQKLNRLKILKLHVVGPDMDLWIKLGPKRAWAAGGGANIPSFEIFTSPDWRGTDGWIKFNQPLYRYGNLIEGIELEFKNGIVVKSKAKRNEKVLKAMIATKNANKVGEFSLTDKRFSKITKFMAETLYDENVGGPNGNTHIALGSAYKECFVGDVKKVNKREWEKLGYNDSSVHTDIISTAPRVVTAYLPNGKTKVIYKSGQYTL